MQRSVSELNSSGINNTNKRIRLLNFNLADKLDSIPQSTVFETHQQPSSLDNNNLVNNSTD